jgi:4-amino-4-deoxy-L-arabinose transferase-like glycosyltransferase
LKRFRIPDWLLLLAFCAFFFLWKLSSFGLIGADEPRYAQVAREMLERHDWITPTLGGTAWLEKPPLYYWQAMLAYKFFGVHDWAARLPSVFDASLLLFAVYWFLGRFRPAFRLDSALMLACSAGIVGYARAASMDMPLAAAFTIAMLAWYAWLDRGARLHLSVFYALLALAMLAKGPVAPFLAALIIALFAAARRDWTVALRTLWPPAILLFCMVGLPWYILVQLRNPQFFRVFVLEHNLARFGTNVFHHPEPFWYYLPVTLLAWIPATIFVIVALVWAIRQPGKREADAMNLFLILWIAVVVLFFSISQSKLPGYVLPAIPPGILLLAHYLCEKSAQRPRLALICLHSALAAALVFSAFALRSVLLQHRLRWDSTAIEWLIVAFAVGLSVGVFLRKVGIGGLRVATIVPAVITLAIALRLGAPALNQTFSARAVTEALSQLAPKPLPVAVVLVPRETQFALEFYRNQKDIPRYELRQAPAGEHLVVARAGFKNAFARNVPGRRVDYLGNFPPQNLEFFYVGP